MEAGLRNIGRRKVLSLVCGAFSERWHEIALACGLEADKLEVPWGRAIEAAEVAKALAKGGYGAVTLVHNETSTGVMNPLKEIATAVRERGDVMLLVDTVTSMAAVPIAVEELGLDLCLAGVQKAWGLPPGLALCTVSPRLMAASREAKGKGFYFDFVAMAKSAQKGQTPSTPSISHLYALKAAMDLMFAEGLDRRWARHARMAERCRAWARERWALFAQPGYESVTLTCISNPRGLDLSAMSAHLLAQGIRIGGGYGKLKGATFRIAHMAERRPEELDKLLALIDAWQDGLRD
jgi:aspartate aminotransferase-like enzyme